MKSTSKAAIAIATVCTLISVQEAPAQQLPPQPVDNTPFVIGANSAFYACTFDLQVQYEGKGSTLTLPGSRYLTIGISPGLNVMLTNLSNRNSVKLNITGTLKHSLDPHGNNVWTANGRNLLGDPTTGLVLVTGNFSYVFDSSGTTLVKPLSGVGRQLAICPMLE